jgi:omega-6 fatty acid desaturase (delta-12 desaturase)
MNMSAPSPARCGAELIRASQPFEVEHKLTTWVLFVETVIVLASALALVFLVDSWLVKILAGLMAGLVQVRLFIFYHDSLHGALFRKSRLGHLFMSVVGFYLIAVRSVWKETHDFHHQNNSKLIGSSVGSYPILTVAMCRRSTRGQMRLYHFSRHPLTMACGYLTLFFGGMAIKPFKRDALRHWGGPVAIVIHYVIFAAVVYFCGWATGLCAVILPVVLSMALGAYLFYAQHNFPAMKLASRQDWTFTDSALHSSSMFDMSAMMHWFTGNIGYHHVHHLNHRIPFYRLPEAMAAIPELHHPGRTSWRISDIYACLRLYAWDPKQDRMLTYADFCQASKASMIA